MDSSDKIYKVLASNKKGKVLRKSFKPRHGLRMSCEFCGWTFRGGGYLTKKELKAAEKDQKAIHSQAHLQHPLLNRKGVKDVNSTLQIERDSHAAEIPHSFVEQTTRQTTTSLSYVDVTGASVASSAFAANQDHFVFVTAQADTSTNTGDVGIRMVTGTTPTPIADSEASLDPSLSTGSDVGHRMVYNWWGIVNTTTAQTLKMQFKTADAADVSGIDLITISVIRLSVDLTPNVDYKAALNSTSTTISSAGVDTGTNNASVSLVPPTNNHIWAIFSKARFATGIPTTTGVNSRISRSGGATSDLPEVQQEGESTTDSMYVLVGMRTDTLGNTSQTYREVSKANNTGAGTEGVSAIRTHSGIFMLDLDCFRNVSTNQQDTPQEDFSTTTPYGQLIQSHSITPTQTGDVMVLSHTTVKSAVSGTNTRYSQTRMQIDDADQPPGQTTKAYKHAWWDSGDKLPIMYCTIENLSAASHTIDIDGNVGETGSNRSTINRNITAFSMELQGTSIVMIVTEPLNITESKIMVKGSSRVILVTEPLNITESVNMSTSSSTNFLLPENLELRFSGGSTNIDPHASLGGAKSTVPVGAGSYNFVPADFVADDFEIVFSSAGSGGNLELTLFDNVSKTEAEIGDVNYRQIYLHNSHPTLTMQDVRIYIPENTPAPDEVQIGLGTSVVNGVEQTIADENTAPTGGIAFSAPTTLETAVQCGPIPPGQHRAVWAKRIVSELTPVHTGNNFFLSVHFYSDFA
jgi:hypothetical protein